MAAKNSKSSKPKQNRVLETHEQLNIVSEKLDQVRSRLDVIASLLLDFLLSDDKYEKTIPYTDKVKRLDELGVKLDVISGIVNKPSNYASSRLRESKKRKFSRRQRKVSKSIAPQQK